MTKGERKELYDKIDRIDTQVYNLKNNTDELLSELELVRENLAVFSGDLERLETSDE